MQHICLLAYCQLERNRERERERESGEDDWDMGFGIQIERHKWFLWCWLCMCFLVGVRYTKSMLPVFLFLNRIRKRKENRNEFGHIMHENVTYNDNHTCTTFCIPLLSTWISIYCCSNTLSITHIKLSIRRRVKCVDAHPV